VKLYYKPGACSLAVHIALNAVGASFDIEQVDTRTQRTETGEDFSKINPNGYVPVLVTDDGDIFTEAPAILQLIADQHPESNLAPKAGTISRIRLQEQLNFTASELHKAFSPLFAAEPPPGKDRIAVLAKIARRMDHVERLLSDGRDYLLGHDFTVADAYTFVVCTWAVPTGIGLDRWPNAKSYVARVSARPEMQAAMHREGLLAQHVEARATA
jgi:glutathione S-transferase